MKSLCSRASLAALLPLALSTTACQLDADDPRGEGELIGHSEHAVASGNGMSLNGMSLNGMSLNGMSLNGMSLNGMSLNGMSLNGMSLNGMSLNGMSLNGAELKGTSSTGQPIAGAGLVGARMTGTLSNGASLVLRVDSASKLTGSNADVWAYSISYAKSGGSWAPLCGTSGGAPVLAVPLAGTWNYGVGTGGGAWSASASSFTFGCRGTALAKCVELGYKPWKSVGGVSLRNHHQTCTRMLRADYCGNGQPGTFNGWQVNLYDNVGLQGDTESGGQWVFEARWSPSGALCVSEYRALELVVAGDVPTCALDKINQDCDAGGFTGGALLQTEYDSAGVVGLVEEIVNQNPGTPLADKVEDGLASLESGFAQLARTPPDAEGALSNFEGAAGDFEAAVKDKLLSAGYGNGLLNRIAGVSRYQATKEASANACSPKVAGKLIESTYHLAQGDSKRSAKLYKEAVGAYRKAFDMADDAQGKPCN